MTESANVAERLWRAYAPFRQGRDTAGELASMFALLVLARYVESRRGSAAGFVTQWDRAVAEAQTGLSPVMGLREAMASAARQPDFPLPDLQLFAFLDRYAPPDDVPWAGAFVAALAQRPTPVDAGLPDVVALLLDRHVQEGTFTASEFSVPPAVARLLVGLTAPKPGNRVLDPACAAGGLLAAAAARIAESAHVDGASIDAYTTDHGNRELAMATLAAHGVDRPFVRASDPLALFGGRGKQQVDVVISNPPFNQRIEHIATIDAKQWAFGIPPESNANFAWLQFAWSRLSDRGIAAVIMPPAAAWTGSPEADIRRNIISGGALLAVIALPANLFAHTTVPVHIWVLARDKARRLPHGEPDAILFIDASRLGKQVPRRPRVLTPDDVDRIIRKLREWLQSPEATPAEPGFAGSAKQGEILEKNDGNLDPRLYVNAERPTAARDVTRVLEELGYHAAATKDSSAALAESLDRYERLIRNADEQEPPTLGEIADGRLVAGPSGSHIGSGDYVEGHGVPVVMPKDLADGGVSTAAIRYISEQHAGQLDRFRLLEGDVVLARRGELGRCAVVRAAQDGWVCGTGCFILRPTPGLDAEYFVAYLRSFQARDWLGNHSTGSTAMKTISLAALRKLPVPLPDLGTQRAIAEMMARLDHHERMLRAQLDLAQEIRRDALDWRPDLTT